MPLNDNIDLYVERYINQNRSKLKIGEAAQKEFDEVEQTLNVDNAFNFEVKKFGDVPALYMYSSKSNTLLQVYFGIKEEAGHIELSVKELTEKFKSKNKEDSKMGNMLENSMLLGKAIELLEAACGDNEYLEEVREVLEEAAVRIDDVMNECCEYEDIDSSYVSDETIEVVNEAVYRLYEKASLAKDDDNASVYIKKAEELQRAIESIPEETPVNTSEYDTDVSGGEGEKLDYEEIKDLIGNDKEAFNLLTND